MTVREKRTILFKCNKSKKKNESPCSHISTNKFFSYVCVYTRNIVKANPPDIFGNVNFLHPLMTEFKQHYLGEEIDLSL